MQDDPTPHQKGIITGVYYVGTWLSYVFISQPMSDFFGRRHAALAGTAILCGGAIAQASCGAIAPFVVMALGRAVCGVGVAIVSTSVPLYQRWVGVSS